MKQFSGNFWWTTADYYASLQANQKMNKDYLGETREVAPDAQSAPALSAGVLAAFNAAGLA